MSSDLEAAIKENLGREVTLNPQDEAMYLAVQRVASAFAREIVARVGAQVRDLSALREVLVDVNLAYLAISQGIEFSPEPVVDMNGDLQFRAPSQGEKRSDFAFWPSGKQGRPVNVEAKTLLPDDERKKSNYRAAFDYLEGRVRDLRAKGMNPVSLDVLAKHGLLQFTGPDVGSMLKQIERELRVVADAGENGPYVRREVKYKGVTVATVGRMPGTGYFGTGVELMGAEPSVDPASYVDRRQLAGSVPNVIVVNLDRTLLPLPPTVVNGFADAFQRRKLSNVSGALIYMSHHARELVLNPGAKHPLSKREQDFFLAPFIPPR